MECARHYGANNSTKMVEGVVVDVITNQQDPMKKASTEVVADYDLDRGAIQWPNIIIQSIKAKQVENAVVEEE
jgi:hypothetical protein